jgi:ribosomal protein S18 acetylase RimI-like enzyme
VTVSLRPARHDRGDALAYAAYLNTAADGLFDSLFGGDWRQVVAHVALVPGHQLSMDNVVIAELDGRIVGSCSGGGDGPIPVGLLVRALGWRVPRAVLVWLAGAPTTLWLTKREPGDWYLQSIAVDAEVRGGGVGSALLDDALDRARAAGARRMVLDVRVGNDTAQRLYEHMGMRVLGTSPGPTLPGVDRVNRLGIDLA